MTDRGDTVFVLPELEAPRSEDEGDRFADGILAWAGSAGLLLPEEAWRRAARNYALTGYFIHAGVRADWDEAAAAWEDRADLAARYMILVAAGDEAVFDRALAGETTAERLSRLDAAARFLAAAARGDRPPAPAIEGADLLAAIAEGWRALLARHARASHPAALRSFLDGLSRLYTASVLEHRPVVRDRAGDEAAVTEYLASTASGVGAGLLFQAAALSAPAAHVDERRVALLDEAAAILDQRFRLANDLAGVGDGAALDRDPKPNACSLLVPAGSAGAERAAAVIQALRVCRGIGARIGEEAERRVERLAEAWPWMGTIVRRGVHVGRRVYEIGHYTTATRADMAGIFEELGGAGGS